MRGQNLHRSPFPWLLGALCLVGCSPNRSATLSLTTGEEVDALSRAPAPSRLTLEAVAEDGTAETLADVPLPADKVTLPDLAADRLARFRATARDGAGAVLLRGLTLTVQAGALDGLTLPLFVQRTRELARMPSPLVDGREGPLLAIAGGRHVVVAGGPSGVRDGTLYDLAFLRAYPFPQPLPRAPRSLVAVGSSVLAIDDTGASWVDLSTFESTDAKAPAGGAFADVAGGKTVADEAGASFVVGGTRREGGASARVLRVAADGTLDWITLARARLGAAAVWVPGRGLVIADGAPDGPGVEVVEATATAPVALAFPARDVSGAGAAMLDGAALVLAGGRTAAGTPADAVTLDLGCSASCAPAPFSTAPLPAGPLAPASAFRADDGAVLIVGDASDGTSHAVRLSRTTAAEVPFRVARRGARALAGPTGSVLVAGGAAALEAYVAE